MTTQRAALELAANINPYGSVENAKARDAARAALAKTDEPVAGWKLVPVEPTDEMCAEGLEDEGHTIRDGKAYADALYRAMIAAAPQPPAPAVDLTAMQQAGKAAAHYHAWSKRYTAPHPQPPAPALVSDLKYLEIFEQARNGSTGPMGTMRGIRACIAAYEASTPPETAEPVALSEQERAAYDLVDRFLRNNLDDADYADYSAALETVRISTQPPAPAEQCWCRTCRPITMDDMRFVVCPDCGNKRCPKANDHRNACTNSNEPGQPGSAYPAPAVELTDEELTAIIREECKGSALRPMDKQPTSLRIARAAIAAHEKKWGGAS